MGKPVDAWGDRQRRLRRHAFVTPLVATLLGTVAAAVAVEALRARCTGCYRSVYIDFDFVPHLIVGLLITGFVVGTSNKRGKLAMRAMLTAVFVLLIVGLGIPISLSPGGDVASSVTAFLAVLIIVGIPMFVILAVGYGLGRLATRFVRLVGRERTPRT
jgi:hypothetical protein